jgi:sugar lactone lactonase YvrE
MADALTWLWKGYPAPVQKHIDNNARINLPLATESWKEIDLKGMVAQKIAINQHGEVFFCYNQSICRIDDRGNITVVAKINGKAGGVTFDGKGNLYVADLNRHKLLQYDEHGNTRDVVSDVTGTFLTASQQGIYFSDAEQRRIGFYHFATKKTTYLVTSFDPAGLALSSDQSFLNVSAHDQVFGYSYKILEDGTLDFGQAYIHYHIPYGEATPHSLGMSVDQDNLLYTATAMGVQVSDQLGRVNFIFSKPVENPGDVKLGGPDFDLLFFCGGGKIFSRKINARGVLSWLSPVKPPKPGL